MILSVKSAALLLAAAVLAHASAAFENSTPAVPTTRLDKLVFADLARLKVHPVLCSDAVFVRRAYLDIIGTLPTAKEARDFIQDPDTRNKRRLLIDRLLDRPEFADYWAMRWADILRIKAEFPVNLWPNAAQAYHRWLRASIAENKPYDQFARELLTSSGSNFRVGPVNFFRAVQNRTPEGIATSVALVFMGTRVDNWPANRLAGMAAFYSQIGYKPTSEWKEEDVFWDPLNASHTPGNAAPGRDAIAPKPGAASPPPPPVPPPTPGTPIFPDGKKPKLRPNRDPREVFADWLVTPKNPWFTKAIANRTWYWIMGRGIIDEPDDIRPDNKPTNPALLAYLQKELIQHHYDFKAFCRLILNSQAYQLSSIPKSSTYTIRRMDAEVLIDALNKITGTTELYTSPIPEPFTYIPDDKSAVALPDGSITSPFLALFGRPARATGMENERDHKPLPAQALYLLNSSGIQRKIDQGPKLKDLFASGRKTKDILDELYLSILSRFPTEDETKKAEQYTSFKSARPAPTKRREDWVDIAWSLINSTEFRYRH
jgi:Protein of unknown function (DUF1553)/Protein of unknown function (DUF1549)